MEKLIQMENVVKKYKLGKTETAALNGISLEIYKNDFCVFMGPSGSGKTTLLNLIGLLDYPTSGTVRFLNKDTKTLRERELCRIRREQIGFVFQNFSLIEVLTVEENIGYPLMLSGVPKSERRKKVSKIMEFVGLTKHRSKRPNVLSGGERQRVAIARALVNEPEILIADEFTANLDSKRSLEIIKLMKQYHQNHQTTFIIASHDPMVRDFAEKIFYLKDGMLQ